MDAVSLAGVCNVAQHGVRRFLLVAEIQEWCSLVCSPGLPSSHVAFAGAGCARVLRSVSLRKLLEDFLIRVVSLLALFALGNLDCATFALTSSALVWCLGVACGVRRIGSSGRVHCLVQQWIHVLREALGEFHLFYVAVNSNPEASALHSC